MVKAKINCNWTQIKSEKADQAQPGFGFKNKKIKIQIRKIR